jgi:predicted nucleic acid-binding protein
MSGSRPVLLDSVILIDHLNGIDAATRYLRDVADTAHISVITRAEVLAGAAIEHVPDTRALLDRFGLIVIDREIADAAAELRRAHRWRLPDALQAAAALAHGLRLATRNRKDFPPDRFEFVVVPYEV